MTLLGYERGEAAATFPLTFRMELDRLVALAKERGATADPVIRQRLARSHIKVEIMRYLGLRSLTQFLNGHQPGPESGIFKNFWSEHHQEVTQLAVDILGADAMVPSGRWPTSSFQTDSPGAPNDSASWVGTSYNARAGTIYAGSSQIQRNIIGEMVLGLPKEPRGGEPKTWRDDQAAKG
jgi:alkylation response protein AidB-like acyl-CoA dehydrogenase